MRKSDEGGGSGRLSSSCSSIRSSNYARSYTPSFNTFKYSPSSYTPNISRNLNSTASGSTAADSSSHTLSSSAPRSRLSFTTPSATSTNLSRNVSASHKALYSSPAAARVSVSTNDSLSHSTITPHNTYRGISKYSTIERSTVGDTKPYSSSYGTSSLSSSSYDRRSSRSDRISSSTLPEVKIESGPTTRTHMVHPTSSHIRSRSSYGRTNTVAMFAQQARERAERDEKDRDYKEWIQREKDRESELGLESLHITSAAPSTAQTDFRRAVAPNTTSSSSTTPYRTRYSSVTRATSSATPASSSSVAPMDDVMTTSYSSVAATPPPAYSQLSTSTSTLLRTRRERLEREDESRSSMTPQPSSFTTSTIPPPPPPPPPTKGGHLPRSASAAVISSYKPTAKVSPYEDDRDSVCIVDQGYTGLRNIGNTCFMNSILQMLVNNVELREFFLRDHYKMEINESNPLGSEGRLARAFADFMVQMWNGRHKAIEPVHIKNIVSEKASQFANFAQHDAHEFLSFLLDGLHEDVNRVKKKPLTGTVESHGRHDLDVSNEAWRNHILRNDSIFVDLFHGQLKSHVQCPNCDRVSITFDPFVYLPVPFPKNKKSTSLYFWPVENQAKPYKLTVSYSAEGTVADFLSAVSEMVKVPTRNLRACEALCHRFDKIYTSDMKVSDIISPDYLFVFQTHDETECNEEVVVLNVLQRELYRSNLKYSCHECGNSKVKLKACEECYDAVYCSKECQVANWSTGGHREVCSKRMSSDLVGHPLIVSLPRSQLTYQHLYRVLEAKSRHTVTLFQQPQYDGEGGEGDSMQAPSGSTKRRNGVGAPPTFLQPPGESSSASSVSSTPRRRSVAAEPRSKNQKMFEIRKLANQNDSFGAHSIGDDDACQALESGGFVSINWINQRNGKPYITIDNRTEIDTDVDKTKLMTVRGMGTLDKGHNSERSPHLTQMLSLFSETERLKPEESWYCSTCKEHVEATKRLQLYRLPPVLIIQLKRFVYTAFTHQTSVHRRSKDDRTVEYPLESLDMSPFLSETSPSHNSTMYDLTGVVCHSGSSYFGHYISLGRLADFDSSKTKIEWRKFDDSMVDRVSSGHVQTNEAYLLFYKLRDPAATRGIFKRHYSCDPGASTQSEVKI